MAAPGGEVARVGDVYAVVEVLEALESALSVGTAVTNGRGESTGPLAFSGAVLGQTRGVNGVAPGALAAFVVAALVDAFAVAGDAVLLGTGEVSPVRGRPSGEVALCSDAVAPPGAKVGASGEETFVAGVATALGALAAPTVADEDGEVATGAAKMVLPGLGAKNDASTPPEADDECNSFNNALESVLHFAISGDAAKDGPNAWYIFCFKCSCASSNIGPGAAGRCLLKSYRQPSNE